MSETRYQQTPRTSASAPASPARFQPTEHPQLAWQDGPGPTFSIEKAAEMLGKRYELFPKVLRYTLPRLAESDQFMAIVRALRGRGWQDWHILLAVQNVVLNYRTTLTASDLASDARRRELNQLAFDAETGDAPDVPFEELAVEPLDQARKVAMLSLLKHWELEPHQPTPDFPAIEKVLADRYGYWSDDAPHADVFLGA